MKLVYLSGPYTAHGGRSTEQHIETARRYAVLVWNAGHAAIVPHLNTAGFEHLSTATYKQYMAAYLKLVGRCDAILMIDHWEESSGARAELERAQTLGLPVFYAFAGQIPLIGV